MTSDLQRARLALDLARFDEDSTLDEADDYSAAEVIHALGQDLGPFLRAAIEADLPVGLWQSGGWCMIAVVEAPGHLFLVTSDEDPEHITYYCTRWESWDAYDRAMEAGDSDTDGEAIVDYRSRTSGAETARIIAERIAR